jgi:hypothetical protein
VVGIGGWFAVLAVCFGGIVVLPTGPGVAFVIWRAAMSVLFVILTFSLMLLFIRSETAA